MFVLGTYKLKKEVLHDSINQSLIYFNEVNLPLLDDSADKYNNSDTILKIIQQNTTKYKNKNCMGNCKSYLTEKDELFVILYPYIGIIPHL